MPSYKLRYFDLRGRAEPIRMLFALADVPFEDERIPLGDLAKVKETTPFGQLPVLEVNGTPIPQTAAILRYLAKQYGYYGSDLLEAARIDGFSDLISDFISAFFKWHVVNTGFVPGDKDALYKDIFIPARDKHFALFQKYLKQSSSGFLVGSKVSFADLRLATLADMLQTLSPKPAELFEGFPEIKIHKDKVFALPAIAKHVETRAAVLF